MLMEFIKCVFGSIRFFLTLLVVTLSCLVVWHDVWGSVEVTNSCYIFMSTVLATVVAYQVAVTAKGSNSQVFKQIADAAKKVVKK